MTSVCRVCKALKNLVYDQSESTGMRERQQKERH